MDKVIEELSKVTGTVYSDEQLKILEHKGGMCILASAGSGKALVNGTKVLTDTGYRPIETLKIGDTVFDEKGQKQKVLGVYPQGLKDTYRITFENGHTIECCGEHLWNVRNRYFDENDRIVLWYYRENDSAKLYDKYYLYDYMTKSTKELKENSYPDRYNGINDSFEVPACNIIDFNRVECELDTKVLSLIVYYKGLIKAIRYNNNIEIIDNIINEINKSLSVYNLEYRKNDTGYRLVENTDNAYNNFLNYLKSLEILDKNNNIQIPDKYIYNDFDTRYDMLYVHSKLADFGKYTIRFNTRRMSDINIDKYIDILDSLGLEVYKRQDYISIKFNEEEFNKETIKIVANRDKGVGIVNIEATSMKKECTCIKVSGPSELYLTERCIVTHNTTVLTHLLAKRIKSGEITDTSKLLCTTFSKAGSTEMEDRLKSLLEKLNIDAKIQVKTMHASYYAVLRHFGIIKTNLCSDAQRKMFVVQAIKEAGLNLEEEDIQLVDSLISFQVNNLLDDKSLVKSYKYTLEDVSLEKYSLIRQLYAKKKQEAGLIDFDDLQMYMYMVLVYQENKDILEYCRNKWEYFFVDEFQDVSRIQFEILRKLVTDPNKLIVIGDDDQCIYQWRGADPSIILNICGYYDIQKFVLSTNYRCGGEIVKKASVGIKNNSRRAEKTMIPYNTGGRIKICNSGGQDLYEMSLYAYNYIMDLINNKRVNVSDIAILARNNMSLIILNNMLYRSGVFSDLRAEIKFTNNQVYKDIQDLMAVAENTYNHNIVKRILWKLCKYLGVRGSNLFSNFMYETGASLKDCLGYCLTTFGNSDNCRAIQWKGKLTVPNKVYDKTEYLYSNIRYDTEAYLVGVYMAIDTEDYSEALKSLLELYSDASSFLFKTTERTRNYLGIINYIIGILDSEGYNETKSILSSTEQYENSYAVIPGSKITISTMHGAKGKEWKYVILFANDNISLPSFEGIAKMVNDGVDEKDISSSIDEDRRLSYVGWTRAKEELAIFTDYNNPSVYTLESLGLLSNDNHDNSHIISISDLYNSLPPNLTASLKKFLDNNPDYVLNIELNDNKQQNNSMFIDDTENIQDDTDNIKHSTSSDLDDLDF